MERPVRVAENDDVGLGRVAHVAKVILVPVLPQGGGDIDRVGVHEHGAPPAGLHPLVERQIGQVPARDRLGAPHRPGVRQRLQAPDAPVDPVSPEVVRLRRHALVEVAAHALDLLRPHQRHGLLRERRESDQVARVADHVVSLGAALPENHLQGGQISVNITQRDDFHGGDAWPMERDPREAAP